MTVCYFLEVDFVSSEKLMALTEKRTVVGDVMFKNSCWNFDARSW